MLFTRLTIIPFLAATWCWTCDGQQYNVACPGTNNELQCPEGQVIEVLSMQHGLQSSVDCAAKSQKATDSAENCFHPLMLGWVQFVCNNLQRCRLPKPNQRMFMCDDDMVNNFIQITYNCGSKPAGVLNTVACEEQTAEIKCEKGVLNIMSASFGRLDENTCTTTPSLMTFCTSQMAGNAVKSVCNGRKECKITAAKDYLGEPEHCDDLPKYLTVDYVCQ